MVYLKATKVNVKRNNNHLSVCGVASDFSPREVASETSVGLFEPSIFLKLATWRTYLTRMATMQTLPTAQQQSTVLSVRVSYGMLLWWFSRWEVERTWNAGDDQAYNGMFLQCWREWYGDRDDWQHDAGDFCGGRCESVGA